MTTLKIRACLGSRKNRRSATPKPAQVAVDNTVASANTASTMTKSGSLVPGPHVDGNAAQCGTTAFGIDPLKGNRLQKRHRLAQQIVAAPLPVGRALATFQASHNM